jgi:hypothetical protein
MVYVAEISGIPMWVPERAETFSLADAIEWVDDSLSSLMDSVHQHGGVLIRGLNCCETAQDYEKIMNIMMPQTRDYIGGTSPREAVHNRVMEATI